MSRSKAHPQAVPEELDKATNGPGGPSTADSGDNSVGLQDESTCREKILGKSSINTNARAERGAPVKTCVHVHN
ncbi:hypothetical protein KFL_002150190 [Klebsormidium nitens]|uniref:Uncharacterized protein n=1 Tax=Klebsormidium nitens TaxID=105231 RepID=A0A1Y1I3C5_KLENI|nr:hypothetical protein KFL_002150190 [Klebsormidium nitens]|eukprot:GAQ84983.1 hypothetical protein KFL_002150190 [Klebsormidium nitens]